MNAETLCCNSRTLSLCEKFIAATPSGHFEQARRPLATANAHRHDHEPRAAPLAFDECVTREACAADAIGMADRNRAAVDVRSEERRVGKECKSWGGAEHKKEIENVDSAVLR